MVPIRTAVMRQAASQSGTTTFTFSMEVTQGRETFTGTGRTAAERRPPCTR